MNVSGFNAGYSGSGVKSLIPAKATVKLDVRIVPDQDPREIADIVTAEVERLEPHTALSCLAQMAPYRVSATENPVSRTVLEVLASTYGTDPIVYPSLGASLPTGELIDVLGVR